MGFLFRNERLIKKKMRNKYEPGEQWNNVTEQRKERVTEETVPEQVVRNNSKQRSCFTNLTILELKGPFQQVALTSNCLRIIKQTERNAPCCKKWNKFCSKVQLARDRDVAFK